jgi:hypothetical protein
MDLAITFIKTSRQALVTTAQILVPVSTIFLQRAVSPVVFKGAGNSLGQTALTLLTLSVGFLIVLNRHAFLALHARTRNMLIVLMTSSNKDRDRVSDHNLAPNSYLQKPLDRDEFRKIVGLHGLYSSDPFFRKTIQGVFSR